ATAHKSAVGDRRRAASHADAIATGSHSAAMVPNAFASSSVPAARRMAAYSPGSRKPRWPVNWYSAAADAMTAPANVGHTIRDSNRSAGSLPYFDANTSMSNSPRSVASVIVNIHEIAVAGGTPNFETPMPRP